MLYDTFRNCVCLGIEEKASSQCTLGQKATFYPEINKNLMFEKCEFCEKYDFENVNFVKNEILYM